MLRQDAHAVMLNTRVTCPSGAADGNPLHRCCEAIAAFRGMHALCPEEHWLPVKTFYVCRMCVC